MGKLIKYQALGGGGADPAVLEGLEAEVERLFAENARLRAENAILRRRTAAIAAASAEQPSHTIG